MRNVEEMKNMGGKGEVDNAGGDDYSLGLAFYQTDMMDEALERFEKSVENPESAEGSLFYMGMILFRKGNYPEAINYFKKLLEENPENLVVYNNLAVMLENEGMVREAELLYREAQKISPLASQVLANIGTLMYRREDYMQAREYLERAVHLNRNMAFAYFYLGMTCLKLSMWDEAEEYLCASLQLSPDNPIILNNLGIFHKKTGDFLKGIRYSLGALEIEKKMPNPYVNIDEIFCIIGDWDECVKTIDEAIPESDRNTTFLVMLGDYYYSKKDFEMAHKMWQRASQVNPKDKRIKRKLKKLESLDSES
jgi:tetratricopeptide (TPR) repeat protein